MLETLTKAVRTKLCNLCFTCRFNIHVNGLKRRNTRTPAIGKYLIYSFLLQIIHRDLAARNVLVGEKETCKVTDFGMARDVQQDNIYERKSKARDKMKGQVQETFLLKIIRINCSGDKYLGQNENNPTTDQYEF